MSLTLTDLLLSLMSLPLFIVYTTLRYWPFGYILCDIWNVIDLCLCAVSIYTIMYVSIDRYLASKYPLRYFTSKTKTNTLVPLICIWVVVFCIIGPLILASQFVFGPNRMYSDQCFPYFLTNKVVTIGSMTLNLWVPFLIPVIMYIIIYRIVRNVGKMPQSQEVSTTSEGTSSCVEQSTTISQISVNDKKNYNNEQHKKSKEEVDRTRKAMKTIILLLGSFALCWQPVGILLTFDTFYPGSIHPIYKIIFHWMNYINCLLNPFCYAMGNPNFRQAFWKLFKK